MPQKFTRGRKAAKYENAAHVPRYQGLDNSLPSVLRAIQCLFRSAGSFAQRVVLARLAVTALVLGTALMAAPGAQAETRTLKLYYVHTNERAEVTFKRNGRYLADGLKKANHMMRDWRRNEPTKMDPKMLDLLWEVYREVGARDYIHIVSGYRSPATNSMLRRTRGGQAEKSQHMVGRAVDFFIPGVKLSKLRAAALKKQGGGVGYYPRSGSPFVHIDTGNVRHWPRMSRKELVAVFPNGKTLHVPSDGKPLPGYEQALAAYKSKGRGDTRVVVEESTSGKPKTLLAALFGGADESEDEADAATPGVAAVAAAPEPKAKPAAKPTPAQPPQVDIAALQPSQMEALPDASAAPRAAQPVAEVTPELPIPDAAAPEPVVPEFAELPTRNAPVPTFAPRAPVVAPTPAPVIVPEPARPDTDALVAMAAAEVAPAATAAPEIAALAPVETASENPFDALLPDNAPVPVQRPGSALAALPEEAPAPLPSPAAVATADLPPVEQAPAAVDVATLPGADAVTIDSLLPTLPDAGPVPVARVEPPKAVAGKTAPQKPAAEPQLAALPAGKGAVDTGVKTTAKAPKPVSVAKAKVKSAAPQTVQSGTIAPLPVNSDRFGPRADGRSAADKTTTASVPRTVAAAQGGTKGQRLLADGSTLITTGKIPVGN